MVAAWVVYPDTLKLACLVGKDHGSLLKIYFPLRTSFSASVELLLTLGVVIYLA